MGGGQWTGQDRVKRRVRMVTVEEGHARRFAGPDAVTVRGAGGKRGGVVNKTINLVLMILMAGLSVTEGVNIGQNGANARNVLFCLLFAAFAIRRLMIHTKLS